MTVLKKICAFSLIETMVAIIIVTIVSALATATYLNLARHLSNSKEHDQRLLAKVYLDSLHVQFIRTQNISLEFPAHRSRITYKKLSTRIKHLSLEHCQVIFAAEDTVHARRLTYQIDEN